MTYESSDERSSRAAEHPTSNHDLHADVLHLLGIDHGRSMFKQSGIERRLTDVHGDPIWPILA